MRCNATAIALPLFCLVAAALHAGSVETGLDSSKPLTEFHRRVWGAEQGLPQNTVPAIVQSSDGYLWLGTELGLVRFDGLQFRVFDKSNTPALKSNKIDAVLTDHSGDLWIGTIGGGLSRFSRGKFKTFTVRDGLSSDSILCLFVDREGDLWVGTNGGGVNRLRNGHFESYTSKNGLANNEVFAVTQDRDGVIWLATNGGLSRFAESGFRTYSTHEGLPSVNLRSLEVSADGTLWIGTHNGGLSRFRDGNFKTFNVNNGLSSNAVVSIREDARGALWIGTLGGGLNRMVGDHFTSYTSKDGLPADDVWSTYVDQAQNLWIGTGGGGLAELIGGNPFKTYDTRKGLSNEVTLPVYEGRDGSIWIGTNGGGLNRLQDGKFTTITTKDGLADNLIFTVCQGPAGAVWIGTRKGLNRLKNGKISTYTKRNGLPSDAVFASYLDHEGTVWFGTREGLVRWKNDAFETYTTKDGLSSDVVQVVYEDHHHNLWIGTGGGLDLYTDGKFKAFNSENGLSSNVVLSLYEGPDSALWIGTDGGGLNRFKDGKFNSYTAKDGLLDDAVFQILPDDFGNLWMSSDKGIFRASVRDLNEFAGNTSGYLPVVSYGIADGMNTRECNGGFQPAGWKGRDGRLWFPTMKGIVAIDPKAATSEAPLFPAVIESVRVNDYEIENRDGIQIPPGKGELEFHYSAPDFQSPQRLLFKYKLEGFDQDWVEAAGRRVAYYTNIPPGRYLFRVMAASIDHKSNARAASISFRLQPHFYQTLWFYGLLAFAVASLIAAFHQLHIRQLRARERLLELHVKKRTTELRNEVAERERAEEELVKAKEAAESASRVKSEFLANMSHEIRTPMTGVLGMTELALATDCSAEQREYLTIVKESANSLLALINDILDFSKVESGKLELELIDFDLRARLEEILKSMSYRASEKGLSTNCAVQPDVPKIVNSDPVKLRQILVNLLGNAIKFTEKGKVELHVSCDELNSQSCLLHFSVRDTGIGIAQESLTKIFEAFAQADTSTTRKFGGTGLGLAICRRFVQLMGGRIWAVSQLGTGSEFNFTLRCSLSSVRDGSIRPEVRGIFQPGARNPVTPAVSGLMVLVAEDNPANRMLTRHALESAGFEVREVENGRDAIEEASRYHFDVILMDCRMPVMDGYLAAKYIRQLPGSEGQVPIIALTASAFKEDREKAEAAGMDDFISKPFLAEELVAKCRMWAQLIFSHRPALQVREPELAAQNSVSLDKYSPDFIKGLLETFLATAPPVFQELVTALQTRNSEAIQQSAHWLQGGASRILNPALQKELKRVEEACHGPSSDNIYPDVASLHNSFRLACQRAETWLTEQSRDGVTR